MGSTWSGWEVQGIFDIFSGVDLTGAVLNRTGRSSAGWRPPRNRLKDHDAHARFRLEVSEDCARSTVTIESLFHTPRATPLEVKRRRSDLGGLQEDRECGAWYERESVHYAGTCSGTITPTWPCISIAREVTTE